MDAFSFNRDSLGSTMANAMRTFYQLGASLYVPATRPDLAEIAAGVRLHHLRSMIFCTEDSVAPSQVDLALENLAAMIEQMPATSALRFVRVRNPAVLKSVLAMAGVEQLDGFVLPKTTRHNLDEYLKLLAPGNRFWLMPTLETAEVFDTSEMIRFRNQLEASSLRHQILALRIGGSDLLNLLGLRRPCGRTIYDTPLASTIANLITIFRPAHYDLTAPVFDGLEASETLASEVARDVEHGLISKSAVHPQQIATIELHYGVSREEFEVASAALDPFAASVFRMHGVMCEPTTHQRWAQAIVERRRAFGVRKVAHEKETVLLPAELGGS